MAKPFSMAGSFLVAEKVLVAGIAGSFSMAGIAGLRAAELGYALVLDFSIGVLV